MIALLEGDWKSPFPIPIIPEAKTISHIVVVVLNVVKIISAIIYTVGPARVKCRPPYLPARFPLIGAITDSVTEYGKINKPALKASNCNISIK